MQSPQNTLAGAAGLGRVGIRIGGDPQTEKETYSSRLA